MQQKHVVMLKVTNAMMTTNHVLVATALPRIVIASAPPVVMTLGCYASLIAGSDSAVIPIGNSAVAALVVVSCFASAVPA